MEKKDAAKVLYLEGMSAADIGRLLKVSENTLSKWVNDGEWKTKRVASQLFEATSTETVRELIGYQLEALRRKKDEWIVEGRFNLLDRGDIDALQKLFTTIRRGEVKWDDNVRIIRRFMEHLQEQAPDQAKALVEHADIYLNDLRKTFN